MQIIDSIDEITMFKRFTENEKKYFPNWSIHFLGLKRMM